MNRNIGYLLADFSSALMLNSCYRFLFYMNSILAVERGEKKILSQSLMEFALLHICFFMSTRPIYKIFVSRPLYLESFFRSFLSCQAAVICNAALCDYYSKQNYFDQGYSFDIKIPIILISSLFGSMFVGCIRKKSEDREDCYLDLMNMII